MAFNDYREPIVYVVERFFAQRRMSESNSSSFGEMSLLGGLPPDSTLPTEPTHLVRNTNGVVEKIIYGDFDLLQNHNENDEFDPVIWQQELIRENDKVVAITTTYPNGATVTKTLVWDSNNKLDRVKIQG